MISDIESRYTSDESELYNPTEERSDEVSSKSLLSSVNIRLGFVRKVIGIVLMQLIVTAFISFHSMNSLAFTQLQRSTSTLYISAILLSIGIPISLVCSKKLARTVPINFILLSVFTSSFGYLVSLLCGAAVWDEEGTEIEGGKSIVTIAALMTIGTTISLLVYSVSTKSDITFTRSLLFIASSLIMMSSFMLCFFQGIFINLLLSSLASFIYGLYIVYDLQLIIGGRSMELSIDDYILGAMMLYIDIVRFFVYVLSMLAKKK